jgi:hypothetical protein
MQGKTSPSRSRKCIACGIEKPLNEDHFQPIQSFTKGFSFYCNACDLDSRKQKSFAQPVVTDSLVNTDNGPDLEADLPT